MLTKESSRGFAPRISYPVYEYHSKQGRRTKGNCDGSQISPTPKGYREVIRYHNEDEEFSDYLKWIREEHEGKSDSHLTEHPYGIFIGAWRNARWQDEIKRRGLS